MLFLPDSKTGRKAVVLSGAAQEVLTALPQAGIYVIASASAGTKDERPRADLKKPWAAISGRAGLVGVRLHDLRSHLRFGRRCQRHVPAGHRRLARPCRPGDHGPL